MLEILLFMGLGQLFMTIFDTCDGTKAKPPTQWNPRIIQERRGKRESSQMWEWALNSILKLAWIRALRSVHEKPHICQFLLPLWMLLLRFFKKDI